jgi:DNA-binding NarL/FixJ family response regulator
MTIMVVDDNAHMRELIKSIFDSPEDCVVQYASGDAAVSHYAADSPDWVLMDIRMEGMDGMTASRTIIKQHPEAKIIIVTNCPEPELCETALSIGASGYVMKDDLFRVKRIMGL